MTSLIVLVEQGKAHFSPWQKNAIAQAFKDIGNGQATLKIGKSVRGRSLKQNSYIWGVCYTLIAEHTGYSTEEVHEWCKGEFLPRSFVTIGSKEQETRKSTVDLTTIEFNEYKDRIIAFAAAELSVIIPEPDAN